MFFCKRVVNHCAKTRHKQSYLNYSSKDLFLGWGTEVYSPSVCIKGRTFKVRHPHLGLCADHKNVPTISRLQPYMLKLSPMICAPKPLFFDCDFKGKVVLYCCEVLYSRFQKCSSSLIVVKSVAAQLEIPIDTVFCTSIVADGGSRLRVKQSPPSEVIRLPTAPRLLFSARLIILLFSLSLF